MEPIGVIGVGSVGRALGGAMSRAGLDVVFGVRVLPEESEMPEPICSVSELQHRTNIVVLAVPAPAAKDALAGVGDVSGKVVIDCTNPVRWDNGPVWSPPAAGSVAAELAGAFPGARVVKGFNHFGAEIQADPSMPGGPTDALFAADDSAAKATVMKLAARVGFNPLDAGPLRNAALLENLAVTWIHMATVGGVGRQYAFRLEQRD